MAWRNLWRHRRRTLITVFGVSFGVLLAVLFTGIGDDSYTKMIDLAARLNGGHVVMQHPDYLEMPALKRTVPNADELMQMALADPEVKGVVTRISGPLMLATAKKNYGAFVLGISPKLETAQTLSVMDSFEEGGLFETSHDKGIILGKKLADNLGVKMGKKVVYTMTDKHGEIVSGLARVSGIIKTNSPTVDSGLCLLPIDTLRQALSYDPHEATSVGLFIDDQRGSNDLAARLGPKSPKGVAVLSWRETQAELANFIMVDASFTIFLEFIILVLVAAGVFNTLFVSVMERMREFGIMMAIGFSPQKLFRLVMAESFWLGIVGLIVSGVITSWPYYYLHKNGIDFSEQMPEGTELSGIAMDPIIYVNIFPEKVVIIALVVLTFTLLSGIYPALRAGKVSPAQAIKLV